MAATEQLQFTDDPISLLSTNVLAGSFSGTLSIDYATGDVTGSITTSPVLGSTLPVLTYQNFKATFDTTTGLYTLSSKDGILGLGATTFSISFSGQAPMTATSSLALVGTVPTFGSTADLVISAPIVCYASGTRIRTDAGERPVEALRIGDMVVTASGAHRPIKWLGHRTFDCGKHPRPHQAYPVRIAAHAFTEGRPARDLLVSPNHAICVDVVGEVLIPACALVNGATIRQVEVDTVTYWHVELDSHDIVLAEGLPAESYIELGNRGFFAEADVVDLVVGPDGDGVRHTTADYCRPFHVAGALVDVAREQLRVRAESLGWRQRHDDLGDLHLVVDGTRIEPVRQGLAVCFALPPEAGEVWLVSSAARPLDSGAGADPRWLGASLSRISVIDGLETIAVPLDDARLEEGFHPVERVGDSAWRWTTGRALLPAALWAGAQGSTLLLRIELSGPALPNWQEPQADVAVSRPRASHRAA